MPMSDGQNQLRKIAFQVGDRFFRFAINPQHLQHRNPHRTTAVKTKSRIVIEDFQNDVPVYSIRGTTGFNPTGKNSDRGINKIKELKRFIENYTSMGGNGSTPPEDFYFHNFTNDESYVVHLNPEGINFTQSENSPLTFDFEITFAILRKAGEPSDDDIVDPEIGNRFPSIPVAPGFPSSPYPIHPTEPNNPGNYPGEYNDSGSDDVYNDGSYNKYRPSINSEPVNPQAPSPTSYGYGTTGLGYSIGYYGRARR